MGEKDYVVDSRTQKRLNRLMYMTKRHVSRKDTIWTTTGIEEDSAKSLSHCQVVVPGLSYLSLQ